MKIQNSKYHANNGISDWNKSNQKPSKQWYLFVKKYGKGNSEKKSHKSSKKMHLFKKFPQFVATLLTIVMEK